MIRILIIGDQNIIRQGIQALLEPKPKLKVVGTANNSKNQQLSRRSIRAIIDRYLIATGLKYKEGRTLSAHSLRQVQDLLGHADPRTTSIYAHVGDR
jgi:site-specific recombinase XerD